MTHLLVYSTGDQNLCPIVTRDSPNPLCRGLLRSGRKLSATVPVCLPSVDLQSWIPTFARRVEVSGVEIESQDGEEKV